MEEKVTLELTRRQIAALMTAAEESMDSAEGESEADAAELQRAHVELERAMLSTGSKDSL
jgi:hypothetical protein